MVEWVHQTVALRERCDGAGVERGSLLLLPEPPRSQHNQDKRKTFAYPTLAGSSRGHDEAGHDLPSHAEVQACSPVLHATASHLGGGILPQDAGGGLTLSERQLTITRQLSTAQAIRYSRRQRPVAVIRSQSLSLTVLPIPFSGLLQRTGSRSLVDRRANRQHKREARDG